MGCPTEERIGGQLDSSHKLLLGNDVLPKTRAKNRENTPIGTVFEKEVTEILSNSRNRHANWLECIEV